MSENKLILPPKNNIKSTILTNYIINNALYIQYIIKLIRFNE